jgi:hypothetical protein
LTRLRGRCLVVVGESSATKRDQAQSNLGLG